MIYHKWFIKWGFYEQNSLEDEPLIKNLWLIIAFHMWVCYTTEKVCVIHKRTSWRSYSNMLDTSDCHHFTQSQIFILDDASKHLVKRFRSVRASSTLSCTFSKTFIHLHRKWNRCAGTFSWIPFTFFAIPNLLQVTSAGVTVELDVAYCLLLLSI